ncbi:MAG: serine protease [Candidatus Jacksonbacteria bacterium]
MNKIEICKQLKRAVRKIVLFESQNRPISWGTGVVVNSSGFLLTANHVISGYIKINSLKIIAYGLDNLPAIEYKPRLFNVSFNINMPEIALPLGIDLAILEPIQKVTNIPCVELEESVLLEGEDVMMAGFPDEVSPPLNFNRILNYENSDFVKNKEQIEIFFKVFMRLAMIKEGMIGGVHKVNISGKCVIPGLNNEVKAEGAVYWIDNGSNHGASGGPVVNSSGKLIGIICEKGLTAQNIANDLTIQVTAGSTMALSHHLITWALK